MLEAAIIMRARAGDDEAIDRVARHVLGLALRIAASITGSRELAEDIAQNTAMLALRSLPALRDPARADGWIARAATRESLQQLRRPQHRRESLYAEIPTDPQRAPADAVFDRIAANAELRAALSRLPSRQRAALALRYVLDLDDRGIADALDCRVGTVHALLSRGRSQLRADGALAPMRTKGVTG